VLPLPRGRRSSAASPPAACGPRRHRHSPGVRIVVTCEAWRVMTPAAIPGLRGPHFSLVLFGPSNPTRAVTSPAWRVPLDRKWYPVAALPHRAGPGFHPTPLGTAGTTFQDFAQDDPEAGARHGAAILRQQRSLGQGDGPRRRQSGDHPPARRGPDTNSALLVGHGNSIHTLALPEQLRQPREVHRHAPSLVPGEYRATCPRARSRAYGAPAGVAPVILT
jgi:hypothetical protein